MKRTLIAAAIVASTVGLTACGSMTLDDGGRYDGYRATVLELATAAQETERIRILALSRLAETSDDRTRDRIVSELQARPGQPVAGAQGIAAPAAPTHLGLEALRILGPGSARVLGLDRGLARAPGESERAAPVLVTDRSGHRDACDQSSHGACTGCRERKSMHERVSRI
jgi:hypothetical protein